jgi:hypothetical protein
MHRVDFSKDMDPNAALTDGTSPYMKDLSDKIVFVREAILSQLHVGDLMRERFVILPPLDGSPD